MHQIVVDTDVLILHLRGNASARTQLKDKAKDSLLCCSAITIGEIHAGMRDEERQKTEKLLNSLLFCPIPAALTMAYLPLGLWTVFSCFSVLPSAFCSLLRV